MAERRFNFQDFYLSIIKSIDTIRSRNGDKFGESRINAFYRALGLPAIGKNIPNKPYNNNVFSTYEETDQVKLSNMRNRTHEFFSFQLTTLDNEIDEYLKSQKGSVKNSIDKESRRKNSKIFPLYADAERKIIPNNSIVAPAFSIEKNITADNGYVRYKRPFIETVISIKLAISGVRRYGEFVSDNKNDPFRDVAIIVEKEITNIGKDTLQKLEDIKFQVDDVLLSAIKKANEARRRTGVNIIPPRNSGIDQNPAVADGQVLGEVDKKKRKIEAQMLRNRTRMAIFDFDDTFKNNGVSSNLKNMTGPLFSGKILDVVIGEEVDKEELGNTNKQLKKNENILKTAYKDLDSVIGTYSGLSGVDILAIILGLFRLDIKYLVGLLNDTGKKNLSAIKGESAISNAASMPESVAKLEEEVTKIIDEIDTEMHINKLSEKLSKRKRNKIKK